MRLSRIPFAILTFCGLALLASCSASLQTRSRHRPVIGIAWVSDSVSVGLNNYLDSTIVLAGGRPVRLSRVQSDSAWRIDSLGMVDIDCARMIRADGYRASNAADVMDGVDAVIFPGGEDISNTLYANYVEPVTNEAVNPVRDVSDYLLMDYCINKKVPILCICRGEQMLGVYSGAPLIQDIPLYCKTVGLNNADTHRMPPGTPHRTYARHDVSITDNGSLIHGIVRANRIKGVPSWHHQAIYSTTGTPLKVTASYTDPEGLCIIEAVERTDVPFAIGVQFHPEYACRRHFIDGVSDEKGDFERCFDIIKALVRRASR
jgi:putative glutamine amidotransferase